MTPAELRRIAEAATPGPWELDKCDNRVHVDYVRAPNDENLIAPICSVSSPGPNAEFIATFNPQKVLEMIDQIEASKSLIEDCWDRLAAVEKLHEREEVDYCDDPECCDIEPYCGKCQTQWPCDDIKAVRGE